MSDPSEVWFGRVFASGDVGGNHTAVIRAAAAITDPAVMARALGVPDTGFVVSSEPGSIVLRTFSPFEELAQCLQTTLAAVVTLDAPMGVDWHSKHIGGEQLTVRREGHLVWVTPG